MVELEQGQRNVLSPKPLFEGQPVVVYEGETIRQVLERSEEILSQVGVDSLANLDSYRVEIDRGDGLFEEVSLDASVEANAKYEIAPDAVYAE